MLSKVQDFSDAGKKCLVRLKLQIEKRLPKPSAMDCLPVLLDPATKMFASWLLGDEQLVKDTTALLKEKHVEAYKAWKSKDTAAEIVDLQELETPVADMYESPEEEEEEDFDDPGIMLANDEVGDGNGDLHTVASGVFEA